LTINIAAVVTALIGAFVYQRSPLAAIQLLWVNLLQDSIASLALASEPPVDALLEKPPVNRTDHIITSRMLANMLGQSFYQLCVVMILLFNPDRLNVRAGHEVLEEESGEDDNSEHYTIIFNAFVWMQLFNEVNCRKVKGECKWMTLFPCFLFFFSLFSSDSIVFLGLSVNVFSGVLSNPLFCSIWLVTSMLQVIIVQYGSVAFAVVKGGLSLEMWGLSLLLGMGSLPVQQIINLCFILRRSFSREDRRKHHKDNVDDEPCV